MQEFTIVIEYWDNYPDKYREKMDYVSEIVVEEERTVRAISKEFAIHYVAATTPDEYERDSVFKRFRLKFRHKGS